MLKFKPGDKVLYISKDFYKAKKGEIYEVESIGCGGLDLVGHPRISKSTPVYCITSFQLVVENSLTVDELVKALLENKDIEVYGDDRTWFQLARPYTSLDFKYLLTKATRLKPKTPNLLDIPKPLDHIPKQKYVYYINLFKNKVLQYPVDWLPSKYNPNFWGTEEEAEQVLKILLEVFNKDNLNE